MPKAIRLPDMEAALAIIDDVARKTPLKRSTTLSTMTGGDVHLKLENFQRTGSFKVRGALNKLASLSDEERKRGVVAASAGNHAQGVAYAATKSGVRSTIFMPEDAALAKVEATKGYGAQVRLAGRDYNEAYEHARRFQEENGSVFVHAFDDPYIIAGQATLGLEIMEDLPDMDVLLVPIGGGGLIAGVASAVKARRPEVRIIGVQAKGASTLAASLEKGTNVAIDRVETMADGIACRQLGEHTFPLIQENVDDNVVVGEGEIASAILFLLERTKVVVEGAGAVTLAALMHGHVDVEGKTVCCLVSGGNIDMTLLSRIIERGLVKQGRIIEIETTVSDRPGGIAGLLALMAQEKANVLEVIHDRHRGGTSLMQTTVQLHVETRGEEHIAALSQALAAAGYKMKRRR